MRISLLNCTERARIEAQIKAADLALRLKAEAEKKLQRERDREAARIALQKVIYLFICIETLLQFYSILLSSYTKYPLPAASVV